MNLYRILESPIVYRTSQLVFAPGAGFLMGRHLERLIADLPKDARILDVGCGPRSWLSEFGFRPVGLDYQPEYVQRYSTDGSVGVVASADSLPFGAASFDAVCTVGLLHHLSDESTERTIREMTRVCRSGGQVIVVDAVMPRSRLSRPLAYVVRKLDRGQFIRSERAFLALVGRAAPLTTPAHRFTFALTGLEAVSFAIRC